MTNPSSPPPAYYQARRIAIFLDCLPIDNVIPHEQTLTVTYTTRTSLLQGLHRYSSAKAGDLPDSSQSINLARPGSFS